MFFFINSCNSTSMFWFVWAVCIIKANHVNKTKLLVFFFLCLIWWVHFPFLRSINRFVYRNHFSIVSASGCRASSLTLTLVAQVTAPSKTTLFLTSDRILFLLLCWMLAWCAYIYICLDCMSLQKQQISESQTNNDKRKAAWWRFKNKIKCFKHISAPGGE